MHPPVAIDYGTVSRARYTDEQKTEALALYVEHGPSEAARQTGIAKGTLASWAHREGLQTSATENLAVATEAALVRLADRKAQLASDLMDDIERLRLQLFAPCVEKKIMTVGTGDGRSKVVVGEARRTQPTFTEQRQIMTALAIAVDKVQILTGEATERIDLRQVNPIDEELQRLAAELEHQAG